MKEKRLLNELGNVNDEFVEQAKPKVKNSRKGCMPLSARWLLRRRCLWQYSQSETVYSKCR